MTVRARQKEFNFEPPQNGAGAGQDYWEQYVTDRYGDKALFTLTEIQCILGGSRSGLYYRIKEGAFDVVDWGTSPRITRESLIRYLRDSAASKPAKKKRKS